jgi:2-dehydro-3-deoxyglucarate aldolase/4-hydroxy-2-oxoheptanedioate aldolase
MSYNGGEQVLKPNRFKQLVGNGQIPVGHMLIEFASRGVAQILEVAGVDFAVVDMEHGSFTISDLADMTGWLKATHVAPFVRVPEAHYHLIARALDAGVLGVVVPNVQSGAQARTVVDAARYPPLGRRGFHFGGASSDFRSGDPEEYVRYANENTTVICMIESPEGVDSVGAIAATPGVDALWVGHWDLTQYMGIRGQFRDAGFLDSVRQVLDAAHKHGLAAIIQPGDTSQLEEFAAMGFNAISYGGDFCLYRDALTQAVADVRRATGDESVQETR